MDPSLFIGTFFCYISLSRDRSMAKKRYSRPVLERLLGSTLIEIRVLYCLFAMKWYMTFEVLVRCNHAGYRWKAKIQPISTVCSIGCGGELLPTWQFTDRDFVIV